MKVLPAVELACAAAFTPILPDDLGLSLPYFTRCTPGNLCSLSPRRGSVGHWRWFPPAGSLAWEGGSSGQLVEKEINRRYPGCPGNDEISPGVSGRLTGRPDTHGIATPFPIPRVRQLADTEVSGE